MIKQWARAFRAFMLRPGELRQERILVELGRMQAKNNAGRDLKDLREAEFQVFSQHAEDGIIQYLTSMVPVKHRHFVEFGVQDYRESNTRFLLVKDRWSGLILDAGEAHLRYVRQESWLGSDHDLTARRAFITRENIDQLLDEGGAPRDLGLLSVDIDGNDYWIFQAITRVRARILVLEYNSFFGPDLALSVPYEERFERFRAHPSGRYFGASLRALADLAASKGYALLGCDSQGVNAFFVLRELLGSLRERTVQDCFVEFRPGGGMGFPAPLRPIAGLPLVDTASGERRRIGDWFTLT